MLKRLLLFVVVLFSLEGMAAIQACPDEKAPIKITMVVILASEEGDTIDPRLKAIAAEIQKREPNLKSFCLKDMQSKSLKPGEKVVLPLVEKENVDLIVKHGANKENRVSLAVKASCMREIEYQTVCGKFLPIVTCYRTKERQRLILAIRVQPCKGK